MRTWSAGAGVFELPDGRRVRGGSLRKPREGESAELTVALTARRPGQLAANDVSWVEWPDFWLPASTSTAVETLTTAHRRAWDERVEICCDGGVGRTGAGLAFLVMLGGLSADAAVSWVRERYHPRAVETPSQRRWLKRVEGEID